MNADIIRTTAATAKMAAFFLTDQKEANAMKVRILKAGLGQMLYLPENWDEISEDEKQRRLDKAIEAGLQQKVSPGDTK